jgi:hypothetical protein
MRIVIFSLAILLSVFASAQTQDSYEYQSEFIWGINKNTSSGLIGGLVFKKAFKLKNDRVLKTYGVELINIKHPQETRRNAFNGNFYLFGKTNYLYAIRGQYGRDLILFKKAPQQGVEIKAVFAGGPTIGLLSPYYVEYTNTLSGNGTRLFAPYTSDLKDKLILGPGRIFQGLYESKIVPGINLKAALNFELGTIKDQVTGFEAGFLLDVYSQKMELMLDAKQYAAYPTLFITLFYGRRK